MKDQGSKVWKRENVKVRNANGEQSVGSPERGLRGFQRVRITASVGRKTRREP